MRKMKDSGIEWLGMIPEDWETERLQWHISEIKESNKPEKSRRILSLTNKRGVIPYEEKGAQGNVAKEDYTQYKLAYPGTIVANSMNILIGSVGKCDYFGCVSPVYYVFKPNNGENLEFINYIFQTEQFQKELRRYANGILEIRLRVSSDGILKRKVPFPSIYEQAQIVSTIESSTSKVDALISNVQAQIEKLKAYKQSLITEVVTKGLDPNVPMKDSGVEWIGKMPAHWDINRIKYVSDFAPTCNTDTLTQDSVVAYAPMECIKNGYFERRSARYGSLAHTLTPFQNGDIVMAKVTPCFENGNIAVMKNLDSDYGLGSSELFVFRPRKIFTQYLMYWLQNQLFVRYACATMTGTGGLKRVSPAFVRGCNIHTPPVAEQKEIAAYLDTKCAEIDQLIAVKQSKIEKLEQYKRSLIYEYVTGKKEVS